MSITVPGIPDPEGGSPHGQHVSGVVVHAWNPSTCEPEVGRIQGQPQLGAAGQPVLARLVSDRQTKVVKYGGEFHVIGFHGKGGIENSLA